MFRHVALKHATFNALKNSAGFPACFDLHSLETISENTNKYVLEEKYFQGENPKVLPTRYALPADVIPKVGFLHFICTLQEANSLPRMSNLIR